jgi:uncharacterized protein (DUF1810 family)
VSVQTPDPFDLEPFVSAQAGVFERALAELQRGRKESHWMWFIFPQFEGLGSSAMARRYAIRSSDEAAAYLAHPVLGPRLLQCCQALLDLPPGSTATSVLGPPDDLKLRSSLTLFAQVSGGAGGVFLRLLQRFFSGEPDARTLELLRLPKAT